ncbi:hypothetical protein GGR51DRAFT_475185 [Nemania sp. FL0031]|nr:hypothetical protein GGR51DRAFT_475185 [Nemania sp. FL0031]
MSPSPPPASGAQKPPVHARISMDDSRHPAEIKETYEKAPDDAFQEAVFDTEATKTHNAELKQRSSSALRNAQQNTTPSIQQPQSTQFPEEIDVRNTQKSESINEKHTDKLEAQILPYVLHGEGAYQLPVPLELKLKRKLQGSLNFGHSGKELTEKLAFLSSNQVQILQTLLRDNSGDQKRKLAHIEVAKKSSMRFWQRYTKVMIAFIEGEASGMPEGVSLVVPDLASTRSEDEDPRLPKNSPFVAPQYRILGRSSTLPSNHDSDPELSDEERPYGAWEEPTNSARTRRVRQQNDIPRIPVAPATSLQSPGQPNLPNMAGMFGIQDITHLLVADEERRKRLAQYKVWTIQPFWGIDQTEGSNNVWGRCVILEEHPDIPDVERRLTALDKDSMTTFDKMRTLTVSQQVQVQQSLEEVKSGTSDPEYQWKLRQLDVVRSTGWFKQNQIKKIVVYACPEPLSPAFKQHEESQSHHLQQNENSYGHPNNIQYDMGETGEDYIRRQPRDSRWHDIERANKAIASRSPPPRRSYERPVEAMRRQSSAYSRSRSPTTIQPRRPSTVPENALYTDYDPTDDDDPSGPDGFNDAKYYWPPNDDHGSAPRAYGRDRNNPTIQVRGNEVDLRKRGVISHPRRDMEVQRGRSPGFNHHPSTDWNSNLQSRRPSRRDSSYSRAPRHRRKSFTDLFMDKEKLRARLRENQTYPDEFDKRRYDPQLSSKAVKDKIDQLVIEWTPGWKNGRDNNNDGTDLAESIAYPHSTITLTEEPETLPSSSTSRAAATSLVEPRVDSQVESFSGKLAREVPAGKKLTFSPGEDWTSGTPATQPPLARTAMIESGDGASVSKPISEHPSNAVPPQTPDKSEDEDIGIPPIQKGDRAATLPTSMPGAQAWDIEWAKQIIEKTGTLSDPEDYQPLPRRSSRVVEESSSRRDRERQRGRNPHRVRQQFNTQHQRSPTAQRRSRNRSRGRYLTPPRRRTVEFQDVDDGHVPPRGPSEERYRQQPRGRYRQDGHY